MTDEEGNRYDYNLHRYETERERKLGELGERDRRQGNFNLKVLTDIFDRASPEWTDRNSADGFFSNSPRFEGSFGSVIDLLGGRPDTEYRDRTDNEKRNLCNIAGCSRTTNGIGIIFGSGFCDICAERGYFGLGNKDLPIWESRG
tara:strand:+ start:63 stop:497 length:435 start_codon:yes stop_codon:yes gene_type:complete